MNVFFVWHNKETGERELVTAPLDGTILPGVTRATALELARSWGDLQVSCLLCTVTFHANHAHNLTRSP
jgi:branched-chain amino acid aminotransferase